MSGLMIKLRPREQIMINGVVIENGLRSSHLRILTEEANILRMRDAIPSDAATTPLRRAYYFAQQAVAGLLTQTEAAARINEELPYLKDELPDRVFLSVVQHISDYEFYAVMRDLWDRVIGPEKGARERR